jgi:hypothetical protein
MPEFWFFLEKRHIPDQSTLRKLYLPICYEETLEDARGNTGDPFYGLLWKKQRIPWFALSRTLWLASWTLKFLLIHI